MIAVLALVAPALSVRCFGIWFSRCISEDLTAQGPGPVKTGAATRGKIFTVLLRKNFFGFDRFMAVCYGLIANAQTKSEVASRAARSHVSYILYIQDSRFHFLCSFFPQKKTSSCPFSLYLL